MCKCEKKYSLQTFLAIDVTCMNAKNSDSVPQDCRAILLCNKLTPQPQISNIVIKILRT